MEELGDQRMIKEFADRHRIVAAVGELSANPYPSGVKKLSGADHTYRIRQGSYRVVYTVSKSSAIIEIVRIGHRKDVYDR